MPQNPRITIEGVPPYDGEYEVDQNFTNREFHTIKQVAGIRAGDLQEAMEHKDTDLIVALAVNCLRRAGLVVNIEALWEAETGKIMLLPPGDDAVPPPATSSQSGEKPSEPIVSSGTPGNGTGDSHQVSAQNFTGHPV